MHAHIMHLLTCSGSILHSYYHLVVKRGSTVCNHSVQEATCILTNRVAVVLKHDHQGCRRILFTVRKCRTIPVTLVDAHMHKITLNKMVWHFDIARYNYMLCSYSSSLSAVIWHVYVQSYCLPQVKEVWTNRHHSWWWCLPHQSLVSLLLLAGHQNK